MKNLGEQGRVYTSKSDANTHCGHGKYKTCKSNDGFGHVYICTIDKCTSTESAFYNQVTGSRTKLKQ